MHRQTDSLRAAVLSPPPLLFLTQGETEARERLSKPVPSLPFHLHLLGWGGGGSVACNRLRVKRTIDRIRFQEVIKKNP